MDDKKDLRSFGSCSFNVMKNDGYFIILRKRISTYNCARTNKANQKAVVCLSELPLPEAASRLRWESLSLWWWELRMIAYYNKLDPYVVRHWTLGFFHNAGVFNNKKTKGVITILIFKRDIVIITAGIEFKGRRRNSWVQADTLFLHLSKQDHRRVV